MRDSAYGARGDGVTDDAASLKAAQGALAAGKFLYFPAGSYRFATQNPTDTAAILLSGISRAGVVFAPGAELVMDNLDGSGLGTSHGILVRGACSDVWLVDPRIRWATQPSARSTGDGIRVLGYPSDSAPASGWTGSTGTVSRVHLVNGYVQWAPQTGAIFMGCSDPCVTNFTADTTWADGLHFNACRRPLVRGYNAISTGDDCLAFINYYQASTTLNGSHTLPVATIAVNDLTGFPTSGTIVVGTQVVTYTGKSATTGPGNFTGCSGGSGVQSGGTAVAMQLWQGANGPFNQPGLGEWSSTGGSATGITIRSGGANGIHIAGTMSLSANGFSADAITASGLLIDAGVPGSTFAWGYPASRGLSVSGGAVRNCAVGVKVNTFNVDTTANAQFWTFGGQVSDISIRECTTQSVLVTNTNGTGGSSAVAGLDLKDFRVNGTKDFQIQDVRSCEISGIHADGGASILVFGSSSSLSATALGSFPRHNVVLGDLFVDGGGSCIMQDLRDVSVGTIKVSNATADGIFLTRVIGMRAALFDVILANRGNTGTVRGVMFNRVHRSQVDQVSVEHDSNTTTSWRSLEIGGGDATNVAADGLRIVSFTYRNTLNQTGSDISLQGGSFGPVRYFYSARWYNGGEATPIWRHERWGHSLLEDYGAAGSPLNNLTAPVGSTYRRTDGGTNTTLYVKTSATDATGWVAVSV